VSPHGNYWIYCHAHGRFERGVQLLTVAIVDLYTGRTFMVGAFPYAVRKMLNVLKEHFHVSRVVFDSWYWSEKLMTDDVLSGLKSKGKEVTRFMGDRTYDANAVYTTGVEVPPKESTGRGHPARGGSSGGWATNVGGTRRATVGGG